MDLFLCDNGLRQERVKSELNNSKNMMEEIYNLEKSESLNLMVRFLEQCLSFCCSKHAEKG